MSELVERLHRNADDCEDQSRWATPELAPLLREAATALEAKDAEIAAMRGIICRSASAIGNGAALSSECSIEFMSGLPGEIVAHTAALRERVTALETTLREHHSWHLQSGPIGLQDGEGDWIEIDNAAEYSDSSMYERTDRLLAGTRPDELQPMPRGGMNTWWWEQAVLLRRRVRAAEARAETAERERDEAIEDAARIVERYSLPTIQTPSMWLIDKAAIAAEIRALRAARAITGKD